MFVLKDQIHIQAPPEKLFEFFNSMDTERYQAWHAQDHHEFKWLNGTGLKEGNEFWFRETIGGKTMQKTVVLLRVEKNRYIEFVPKNWFFRLILRKLSFRMEPKEGGSLFTAEILILTGPLGAYLNKKEFDAVRLHMKQEGENLKQLAETSAFA